MVAVIVDYKLTFVNIHIQLHLYTVSTHMLHYVREQLVSDKKWFI